MRLSENEVYGSISTADILINTEVPQLRCAHKKERLSTQQFHQRAKDFCMVCVHQLSLNGAHHIKFWPC